MGSIYRLHSPPIVPENPFTNYRIYTSFCSNDLLATSNMSNWIECYDPSTNSWHHVARIPGLLENQVRKGFSMVSIGDSIYIIGGRLCRKKPGHEPDLIVEVDLQVLPCVIRYDIRTGTWSKCASLGTPRFDFACTVCDNKIYVAGGLCTLDIRRGTSSAEVYDPALDEWKPLPDMSVLRYKCVGVTWQGKVHVIGGFAENADLLKFRPYDPIGRCSAEVYDMDNAKWHLVMGMWQLDVPPNQIVAVDEKLYSSGDCLNAWKGHIEAYDGKIWDEVDGSHLETLSSPISVSNANWPPIERIYITMAAIGTHLFFLAGYRKQAGEISRLTSVVHVFNTLANRDAWPSQWRSLEPLEEEGLKELCCHGCVVTQHHS